MKVIHVPHRVNMTGGNKPSDGETKINPTLKFKKGQARRATSGSRRPRNKGRG